MKEDQYEILVEMFGSEGWKLFIEEKRQEGVNLLDAAPAKADTNDKWQHCRGQIEQIKRTLGFENLIRAIWEEQEKPDVDAL